VPRNKLLLRVVQWVEVHALGLSEVVVVPMLAVVVVVVVPMLVVVVVPMLMVVVVVVVLMLVVVVVVCPFVVVVLSNGRQGATLCFVHAAVVKHTWPQNATLAVV